MLLAHALLLAGVVSVADPIPVAQPQCGGKVLETALDQLIQLRPLGVVYTSDAAADGSIVSIPPGYQHGPRPQMLPFLKCGRYAAAVLIAHLDDTRLSWAGFNQAKNRVPVGYICLDILIAMTPFGSDIRNPETENDDGLGAGIRPAFYFRPDDYEREAGRYIPRATVRSAQKAWQKVFADSSVTFEYPKWYAN